MEFHDSGVAAFTNDPDSSMKMFNAIVPLTIIRRPNHFGKASRNCLLIPGPAEDRRLCKLLSPHGFRLDCHERQPARRSTVERGSGCSKSSSSKAAASEGPEAYPLGYVEDLNDARTPLAGFFSILLD